MLNQNKPTRLGEILLDRGVITRQQLREAIEIQQARQLLREKEGTYSGTAAPIGEILIELGFITRQQLVQSLGWQSRLRKATLVMSFVAPLLTTACGGGGGTPSTSGGNKTDNSAVSSSVITEQSSSAVSFSSSSSSSIALSSQSSSSSSISLAGPALLVWSVPSVRENGEALVAEDIGGYELRYKTENETDFTSVIIEGGYVTSYYFNYLEGKVIFEIAAYDTNGLYSRFVPIQPQG